MRRTWIHAAAVLAMLLLAPPAMADDGLVRTTWPSAEDPGVPFYARAEPAPPHAFDDGEWAAIPFYRDPSCVPSGFNLLSFFDVPGAFACPLTVEGASLWAGEPLVGGPKIAKISGSAAVPVWFVPAAIIRQATQDGVLTIGELAGLEGLLVGTADQFNEILHPAPLPPELGGGGHNNHKLIITAHGQLDDGRQFDLSITELSGEVQTIGIRFR